MKKVLFFIGFVLLSFLSKGQLPFTPGTNPRSNSSFVPEDYNLSVRSGFYIPRFDDTTQANANTKIDTCGRVIFTYDSNFVWIRICSPRHWEKLLNSRNNIATVTGGINGNTLIGSNIGWGGRLIQPTTVSGANQTFLFDSIGSGSRWVSRPQSLTTKGIRLSSTNGTDSATFSVEGTTTGGVRTVTMNVNSTSSTSTGQIFLRSAGNIQGQMIMGNGARESVIGGDTNSVSLVRRTAGGTQYSSVLNIYSDSIVIWSGVDRQSQLNIYRSGAADQWAQNRLSWRTLDSTAKIILTPGLTDIYSDDSVLLDNGTGYYRFTNLTSSSDTTTYKPAAFDINGKIKRMNAWPVGSGSGGTPAGSNTQVQFNDGGSFGANSGFVYDKTNKIVTIDSSLIITKGFLNLGSSTTGKINFGSTGSGVTTAGTSPGGGVWFGPGAASGASMATTATDWVAIGAGALGIQGANSRSNIAVGKVALSNCDSCSSTVAMGANTGNKAGQFVTEVGHEIAQNSLHPNNISAFGYRVMNACINCHDNTAMGKQALESCTDCSYMTAMGLLAGSSVTTGSQDVFLGVGAGYQAGLADPTVSNKFSVFSSSGFSGNALMWGEINNKRLCINCAEGTALTYTLDVRGKLAIQTSDFVASKDTVVYIDQTTGEVKRTRITGTSLTSVGSGFKVAVDNTTNVKSLLAGYSISLDSATSNSVNITVDTATLAPYIRSTIPGAASATWNLTGNASVTTSQFLGTTDANKIRFRTNNTERGYWDSTGGTLFIGAPTYVNNTYGLIIQSPTNNSSQAIKVYSNNLSASAELGFSRLLFSGSADIAMSSGTLKLNSPNGTFVGGSSTPSAFLHIAAGTTSLAPEAFTTGSLLTTIAAFRKEANGQGFYASNNALNRYAEGGYIKDFIADSSNTATTEQFLYQYQTKASTLAADGEKIMGTYNLTLADGTTDKVIKFYFAGTAIYNSGTLTGAVGNVTFTVIIIRTSSSTARALVTCSTGITSGTQLPTSQETDLTSLTFTTAYTIQPSSTLSGAGAGNGDITWKMGTIAIYGAANN